MTTTATQDRYTELRNSHRWEVPELYNMAVDVADRHPRDKRALILESAVEGHREVNWGEIQDRSRQIAATLQKPASRRAIGSQSFSRNAQTPRLPTSVCSGPVPSWSRCPCSGPRSPSGSG